MKYVVSLEVGFIWALVKLIYVLSFIITTHPILRVSEPLSLPLTGFQCLEDYCLLNTCKALENDSHINCTFKDSNQKFARESEFCALFRIPGRSCRYAALHSDINELCAN